MSKNNEIKERKVADILKKYLIDGGWTCLKDIAGESIEGIDMELKKNNETLGIEIKGDAGSNSTDFKTLLGQIIIAKCEQDFTYYGIAVSSSYQYLIDKHAKTLKKLNLITYVIDGISVVKGL